MSSNIPDAPERYRAWWEANTDVPYGYCWCGCGERTPLARWTHRQRQWFRGEPLRYVWGHTGNLKSLSHVQFAINPHTQCWVWQRETVRQQNCAYGRVVVNGKHKLSHRVMYEREHGPIPPKKQLHHRCVEEGFGTTLCCNPAHLEVVTRTDNVRRGRQAKLTMYKARLIRQMHDCGISIAEIARHFGVGETTVRNVVYNRTWRETS